MKSVIRWMVPAVALVCMSASPALAQPAESGEVNYWNRPVRAPANAFELTLGGGYTQGFGRFGGQGLNLDQVAQEGVGVDLGVGYRLTPRWSVGLNGQYQEFRPASSLSETGTGIGTRGLALGVSGTYHFMPFQAVDPFVQVGTGYRMLWETHEIATSDILRHGFQVARVAVGADLRMSEDISIGPVIGADLTAFAFTRANGVNDNPSIGNWGLSSFIFAGLQGRFDAGGGRYSDTDVARATARR